MRALDVVEKYQNQHQRMVDGRSDALQSLVGVRRSARHKFYAIGGYDGSTDLSSAEVYTPSTNTWSRIADMSTPRHVVARRRSAVLIYVFGGYDGGKLDSVEVYKRRPTRGTRCQQR